MNPFPLILSSPSGGGKTTIARMLLERRNDVGYSVSCTTRAPRPREQDGRDYHFVSREEFEVARRRGEFAESAVVHENLYGTLRSEVDKVLRAGKHVIMDIDVQGARQVRRSYPAAVLIFILPPSGEELNRRLTLRGSESKEDRIRRLENARKELSAASEFDYVVVNDDFERALAALEAVIAGEEHRVPRLDNLAGELERLESELGEILERSR